MRRLLKRNIILRGINNNIYDSRLSSNINNNYNIGALIGISMIYQIISGVLLSMNYTSTIESGYNSIQEIMLEIRKGNIIREWHSNGVSVLFILIYWLISRGLYNGSYIKPREKVWISGVILLLLMIIISFLGYSLVCGIQSYWAIIVITNLLSSIPYLGSEIVTLIWSGFSPNTLTIKRFYSLLYLLPWILLAFILILLILLLELNGTNVIGIKNNTSIINFLIALSVRDLYIILINLLIIIILITIFKNRLIDSENNIEFNELKTPNAIVPLWYLLTYYAILRSIKWKGLGVLTMILSILSLIILSYNNISLCRSSLFRLFYRYLLISFGLSFLILLKLGAKLPSNPYSTISLYLTIYYFSNLYLFVPFINLIDNYIILFQRNSKRLYS